MESWLYLTSGLGLLLAEEKPASFWPSSNPKAFLSLLWESFHMIWQILFVLILYFLMIESWIPSGYEKEPMILFLFLLAYGLSRIKGKTSGFCLCVFSLSFFVMVRDIDSSLSERLLSTMRLALGVSLFQIVMVGLKDKLLLAPVPEPLKGLPIVFLTAALVALAFDFTPNDGATLRMSGSENAPTPQIVLDGMNLAAYSNLRSGSLLANLRPTQKTLDSRKKIV